MRLVSVLFTAAVAIGCAKSEPVELPPPKVGVVPVLEAEIADESRFPGRTAAPQRVEIHAQVEGTIHERAFADGQKVERGDVLFKIDARSPEAALAQAKAELARARVNAADAAKIAAANEELFAQGVIGREEYNQSQAEADAAKALVRANEAIVDSAALTRGFATVVAPFDGRIGEAEIDVGTAVSPASGRLAVLARLDPMYVDFALSERQFLRLPATQKLREEVRARASEPASAPTPDVDDGGAESEDGEGDASAPRPEREALAELNDRLLVAFELADGSIHPYQGMLNLVSVEIDEATGTYAMRAVFPNPEELLIPGLLGEVIIRTRDKHPALLIPQDALALKQVGVIVYVVAQDSTLEQRRVELGQRIGDLVEIREGLAPGEVVVSQGVHKCRDRMTVEAVELEPLTLASDPLAEEPAPGPPGWFERFLAERRVATLVGN
jgi:multidrug efflux pump subunit AcrA (membrane-fusion protein)